ncbi:AraC family transcriptional regulator [Rhodoferax saidenbachensis]|uniref:AraC-like DNA-binding protein n=1 Tax=Rhodoferax saidenbachensis TaxID=1484693 RepID=A0ABU1ZIZ7_9BURK|nr:AraC family transcriptional regulator [Rhodoferax saidenbachensis]MDR7305525.1 AraC-like DNA-binding protein [Rhodoferax saidenbachensis]
MKIDFGWASVSLLPSAPYSVRDASCCCVLGLAFERQQGVHAIGADRRQDFDAWPGDLAFTLPEVEVFSESRTGGEYLTLHVAHDVPDLQVDAPLVGPRTVFHGDRQAVRLGWALRRLLHAAQPHPERIEELAAMLLGQGLSRLTLPWRGPSCYEADRKAHARVLDYIDSMLEGPLSLEELAGVAGMPLLRFLRSFSNAVGSTPHAYITERRLQRARRLLRASDAPLADIAFACGFAHQSHLGAVIKERLGLSPRQYRGLAQAVPLLAGTSVHLAI